MKRTVSVILAAMMVGMLIIGCGSGQKQDDVTVRVGALSGPTAMGLVNLMKDAENGTTENKYEFAELSTDPAAFAAPLAKGEIDIAAVPANLASVLYHNTEGQIQVIAIGVLSVLNVVERGEQVQSVSDLKRQTIYATGQGAVPEYTLRYLLVQNGIDPDADLTIRWCSDTTEALSYVTEDENAIAMLPQPFATIAMTKVEGLRMALDLNEEWGKVTSESKPITGVVVVRKEFAKDHPNAVKVFLEEYRGSVEKTVSAPEDTAALIEEYGIVPAAKAAQKALPGCHLTYETGAEMKADLEGFYKILSDLEPKSIGGSLPDDDFYYIP